MTFDEAATGGDQRHRLLGEASERRGCSPEDLVDRRPAGSGDVALTVQQEAEVSIMGSGDVDISGPARCSVSRMGSGNVRCSGGGGDGA